MKKKSSAKSNPEQVTLSLGDGKPLVVARSGGNLTAFGGVPLFRAVEAKMKLLVGASGRLRDHRTGSLIKHNHFDRLFTRVSQIAAGLPDGNDAEMVQRDAAFMKLVGEDPETGMAVQSQSGISRMENSFTKKDLKEMGEFLLEYYISSKKKVPRRIVLFADGSAVETHGAQECAIYRGKYRKEMFFPLFVFDEDGWLLACELRAGDQGEVKRGAAVLMEVTKRLQAAWPNTKIGIRADAAFACPGLFNWCEEKEIEYVVGIAGNFAISTGFYEYWHEAKRQFVHKHGQPEYATQKARKKRQKIHAKIRRMSKDQRMEAERVWRKRRVRVFGEYRYQARKWKKFRRVVGRVDYTDFGVEARYVVTNLEHYSPKYVYEQEYCIRAGVELSIKEFKNSLKLKLSCSQFTANATRLYLHGLAYMLLYHMREHLPARHRAMSLETVRKRFICTPVRVMSSERRVYWGLSDTYVYAKDFLALCRRLARTG